MSEEKGKKKTILLELIAIIRVLMRLSNYIFTIIMVEKFRFFSRLLLIIYKIR